MNITLRAKDVALMTEDLKEFTEKKIQSLEKLVGEGATAHVDLLMDSNHHKHGEVYKVTVEINANGQRYFTEESAEDFKTAVNRAKDELQRQIGDQKGNKEAQMRQEGDEARALKGTL